METLEIAKILQQSGIAQEPAYRVAEAINGRSGLATKEDLLETEQGLKADIQALKADLLETEQGLKADLSRTEQGLRAEIAGVRAEVAELRASMKAHMKWTLAVIGIFGTFTIALLVLLLDKV